MATSHRVPPEEKPAPLNGAATKQVNGRMNERVNEYANGTLMTGEKSHSNESAGGETAAVAKRDRARAASDDTHGVSFGASVIAAPPAANTDHDRSAEAARDSSKRRTRAGALAHSAEKRESRKKKHKQVEGEEPHEPIPPGLNVLPADALAFTEALNAQADFLEVGKKRLLNSGDQRIVKGVWEHMLELRYGKEAPVDENARRIVIDVERPNYDNLPTQ
ncbi:MAG TPA: hypothetical protein VE545_00735 [Candidatus Dormibacteraeota bacterium]|nr:hypothetical protein [Candidatus Dormibacteraeota bacterium]